jgi:hypothetical protein
LLVTKLASLLLLLISSTRLDASCCASGSTGGIGRLLPYERALVELSQDFHRVVGRFGEQSAFKAGTPENGHYWQFNHELQVMARVSTFFLPYVKLPVRTQISSERTGSGLADLTVGARWPILNEHFISNWPGLTLFSSLQLPTGNALTPHKEMNPEDITSLGAMLISLGAALERSFGSVLWTLAYHLSVEPRIFKKTDFVGGPLHAPSIAMSLPLHDSGALSAGLSASFSAPAQFDGKQVRGSSRRKISANLAYAWKFHSHLSLNFSLGGDMPVSYFGKNNNSEVYARMGMRVGVF